MLGIEKIKSMFTFIFKSYGLVVDVMEDGKIGFGDIPEILEFIPNVAIVAANAGGALAELKDIDQGEIEELKAWTAEEFDIPDDELEAKIEEAIAIVGDLGKLGLRVSAFVKSV